MYGIRGIGIYQYFHNSEFIWDFLLKNLHVGVFTPGFGLKEGPNDLYNPVDGYFRASNNIWYTRNIYSPIFLQFRIYTGLFLLKKR